MTFKLKHLNIYNMKTQFYFFKNRVKLFALFMLCSVNAQTTTFFSNTIDLPISDNSFSTYDIAVGGIPDYAHIYHINVGIRADHTFVGDLTFSLELPNGASMGLMHQPGTTSVGGVGDNSNLISNNMILFEDYAPISSEEIGVGLGDDESIPAGAFLPSWNLEESNPGFVSFTDIAADYGGLINDTWHFHIQDKSIGDTGTLTHAEIMIQYDNYCVPFFTNDYENISNVSFSGINYSSGKFDYDYPDYQTVALTDEATPITKGETYPLSVSIDPVEDDYIYMFIDWNHDRDFDDAGETYTVASGVSTTGPHTLDITIPEGATVGETRMRVMLEYNNPIPNPCGSFLTFGEVEDFTLLVEDVLGIEDVIANNKTTVYPNPVADVVNFTSKNNIEQINIYNINGQEVFAQKTNAQQAELNIPVLPSGIYVAKIETDKGMETIKLIKK